MERNRYPRALRLWLFAGILMVTVQIVLGGITRLTGSGLSITKWEIVTGTLPPLSDASWDREFKAYRETPQYEKINTDMNLAEFKFIYMWEYVHRLWARLMGLVFVIPFVIFWRRKLIDKWLLRKLGLIIGLAALAASFGWIMVASGLVERPWVNAYKLTLHLNLGLLLLSVILWTYLGTVPHDFRVKVPRGIRMWIHGILVVLIMQLILGGVMSGMKAGLFYPTWPDMHGTLIPAVLGDSSNWNWMNFKQYDSNIFAPAFFQFLHRSVAYLLIVGSVVFAWLTYRMPLRGRLFSWSVLFLVALLLQIILGILTVINCVGQIPLWLGVLHQLGACLVLIVLIVIKFLGRAE